MLLETYRCLQGLDKKGSIKMPWWHKILLWLEEKLCLIYGKRRIRETWVCIF
jgi:hypothetical protein